MATEEGGKAQVKIELWTKQSNVQLPEETGPILVDTDLRRYGLSTLVNHLLGNEKPVPFDFLINNAVLRTSLDQFLNSNGISAETTLRAEYIPAFVPPQHVASFEHDTWISSVDVLSSTSQFGSSADTVVPGQPKILSGCYDGRLRIWNASSEIIATSADVGNGRYTPSIKAAKCISATSIASGGFDRAIRLWNFSDGGVAASGSLDLAAELQGHKEMVLSLDAHPTEPNLLSASADHTIALWSTDLSSAPPYTEPTAPTPAVKRSKRSTTPQLRPLHTFTAHAHHVNAVLFAPSQPSTAYSASQDGTLRTWNLAAQMLAETRNIGAPLHSLTTLTNLSLVAVGTSTGQIALVDPRAAAATVRVLTLRGHTGFVPSLAPDPNSQYRLVSAGYDGCCRVWDVRSKGADGVGEAVQRIGRMGGDGKGEGKVFAVAWDAEVGIVSAGEDRKVQIDR